MILCNLQDLLSIRLNTITAFIETLILKMCSVHDESHSAGINCRHKKVLDERNRGKENVNEKVRGTSSPAINGLWSETAGHLVLGELWQTTWREKCISCKGS